MTAVHHYWLLQLLTIVCLLSLSVNTTALSNFSETLIFIGTVVWLCGVYSFPLTLLVPIQSHKKRHFGPILLLNVTHICE